MRCITYCVLTLMILMGGLQLAVAINASRLHTFTDSEFRTACMFNGLGWMLIAAWIVLTKCEREDHHA